MYPSQFVRRWLHIAQVNDWHVQGSLPLNHRWNTTFWGRRPVEHGRISTSMSVHPSIVHIRPSLPLHRRGSPRPPFPVFYRIHHPSPSAPSFLWDPPNSALLGPPRPALSEVLCNFNGAYILRREKEKEEFIWILSPPSLCFSPYLGYFPNSFKKLCKEKLVR